MFDTSTEKAIRRHRCRHLRNHGFLKGGGTSWRLSPAFDLNPDPHLTFRVP